MVNIKYNGKFKACTVSRLVAKAFIPIPKKYLKKGYTENTLDVDHIADGKEYNHDDDSIYNLQWLTHKENISKAWKHGLYSKEGISKGTKHPEWGKPGESNPASIYTTDQVKKICEYLVENKLNMQEIADKVGVKKGFVNDIRIGRAWKSVSKNYNFNHYNRVVGLNYDPDILKNIDILIEMGANNNQIYDILKLEKNDNTRTLISHHRSLVGKKIHDRHTYSNEFLIKLDDLIKEGKSNKEIKMILDFPYIERAASLIYAHRRKLKVLENENK